MSNSGKIFKAGAAVAALAMVMGSTVAQATPTSMTTADPLVSLSVFGTSSSRTAVCTAGAAAAGAAAAGAAAAASTTAAAQPGPGVGCVLPVLGTAPPPPVVGVVEPVVPVAAGGGLGGIGGLLPLFAVLGLAALAVAYLENKKDEGPPPLSPF